MTSEQEEILNGKYSESFEKFWLLQLRKIGKGKAWNRWKQKKLDKVADTIIAIWIKQKPLYEKRLLERNIDPPHPETWLNQCRWQDELEQINPQKKRAYL